MGGWREEWETDGYRAALNDERTDHLRVRFQRERRSIFRFTVQYEAEVDGSIFPVVRYDTAHGFVHQDTMDWTGRVVDKLPIFGRTYNQAMTEAIRDIRRHWRTYRAEFEGRPR